MTLDEILTELIRRLAKATPEIEPSTVEEYEAQFKKRAAESAEIRALLDSRDSEIGTTFVFHLFNIAKTLCIGSAEYGDGYMAKLAEESNGCIENKLDELKREHDLKGFKAVRKPEKGGMSKKKGSEEKEARSYWDRWQSSKKTDKPLYKNQEQFIEDMHYNKKLAAQSTLRLWLKEWKKQKTSE